MLVREKERDRERVCVCERERGRVRVWEIETDKECACKREWDREEWNVVARERRIPMFCFINFFCFFSIGDCVAFNGRTFFISYKFLLNKFFFVHSKIWGLSIANYLFTLEQYRVRILILYYLILRMTLVSSLIYT